MRLALYSQGTLEEANQHMPNQPRQFINAVGIKTNRKHR